MKASDSACNGSSSTTTTRPEPPAVSLMSLIRLGSIYTAAKSLRTPRRVGGVEIMGLGALQPGHLIVVLVIVLLIFGPGKLPELGKAMGDGLRELKKATGTEEDKDEI